MSVEELVEELVETSRLRRSLPPPPVARDLRQRAGVSQEELAEPLGVTGACISRWETGSRKPRGPRVDAYARALAALAQELIQ